MKRPKSNHVTPRVPVRESELMRQPLEPPAILSPYELAWNQFRETFEAPEDPWFDHDCRKLVWGNQE